MTMTMNMHMTTENSIPVLTDPFEIVTALCDADEWELARRVARAEDKRRGETGSRDR